MNQWLQPVFMLCLVFVVFLIARYTEYNRVLAWGGVLISYGLMNWFCSESPLFLRTVYLCCVLLAGMKWITYGEWMRERGTRFGMKGKREMPLQQWWSYCLLWFGTDPTPWLLKREGLEWKNDGKVGLVCMLVGGVLTLGMGLMGVNYIVPVFLGMSIAFHFGALRLLVGWWRFMGISVKPLFRNPVPTLGGSDFWGRRWNLAYSQMMVRAVFRPMQKWVSNDLARAIVFLVSGLLHELAITVPVKSGYGLPTLFFVLHGLIVMLEYKWQRIARPLFWVALLLGLSLLFPKGFQQAVILQSQETLVNLLYCLVPHTH